MAQEGPRPALARGFDLSALRFVASVGEPLNAEAVWWGQHELGRPIHDNWWDSIDVLNLAIALHETTGVEIPERDYGELSTLARGVAYLRRRLQG